MRFRDLCWLCLAPINFISGSLFKRKLFSISNQKDFWKNRLADDFTEIKEIEKDPYYINIDKHIISRLKEIDARIYLEVGCYFGYRLNKFSSELKNKRFIGLDFGLSNLLFGKAKVIKNEELILLNADALYLPFQDSSIDAIYTVVSLTHMDYLAAGKAINELIRVCAEHLLLVEVDYRAMSLRKKIGIINWNYGYSHPYEKLVGNRMKLVSITPFYDSDNHPRYTAFYFRK